VVQDIYGISEKQWIVMKILIIGMDLKYNAEFFYKKAFEKLGHEIILINEYRDIKNPFITRILDKRSGLFNHSHLKILKLIKFSHIYKCSINYVFNMRVT
jgi:hypothetical protein